MAEGASANGNPRDTLPQRGKVREVCREWLVKEDGAYAHSVQNDEFSQHYGLNRYNRRTVREDIPVAKIVQSDEERRIQEERYQELQALKAQAEEDEILAKKVMDAEQEAINEKLLRAEEDERLAKQVMDAEQQAINERLLRAEEDERLAKEVMQAEQQLMSQKRIIEVTDEEYAKAVQDKEKKRYEKHLEKKKSRQLKREREELEHSLQQNSREARLLPQDDEGSVEGLEDSVGDLNIQRGAASARQNGPGMRVTPSGRIEDDGDFSDFYVLPENIDPNHRKQIQELQDEELAKLLQEQEHKRTKAEVDRSKLREIEEQDERLAKIIQEQEKIKIKKAKEKKKKLQEEAAKRAQQEQRPPALPPRNSDKDLRRLRRDSFIQSMENGPARQQGTDAPDNVQEDPYSRAWDGASDPPSRQTSRQDSSGISHSVQHSRQGSRQDSSHDISRSNRQQSQEFVQQNRTPGGRKTSVENRDPRYNRQGSSNDRTPPQNMSDVERWLAGSPLSSDSGRSPNSQTRLRSDRSDPSDHIPSSPSPPGSYHSEEEEFQQRVNRNSNRGHADEPCYAVSNLNFNIATAIDPTYQRRKHEIPTEDTDRKTLVPMARSVPSSSEDTVLEWDPGLRGSLRRGSLHRQQGTRNPLANLGSVQEPGTIGTRTLDSRDFNIDEAGGSPWGPVQGQKRNDRARKHSASKKAPNSPGPKQKGSCKQQ